MHDGAYYCSNSFDRRRNKNGPQPLIVLKISKFQNIRIHIVGRLAEQHEDHLLDLRVRTFAVLFYFANRDFGGCLLRIAVDAGADRGEADGADAALLGHRETLAVAPGKQVRFALPSIAVDG